MIYINPIYRGPRNPMSSPERPRTHSAPNVTDAAGLPQWIRPQLTELVDEAPEGSGWLHEIKFDGYRMHARLDRGGVRLLTRTDPKPFTDPAVQRCDLE